MSEHWQCLKCYRAGRAECDRVEHEGRWALTPCPDWPDCDDDEGRCLACAAYDRWLDHAETSS